MGSGATFSIVHLLGLDKGSFDIKNVIKHNGIRDTGWFSLYYENSILLSFIRAHQKIPADG